MTIIFNADLANGLKDFYASISSDTQAADAFKKNPTGAATAYLQKQGVTIPDPATFHCHVLSVGQTLPDEPLRATCERYIYCFRKDGTIEYKVVPAKAGSDDTFMSNPGPHGACACCNCGCFEVV